MARTAVQTQFLNAFEEFQEDFTTLSGDLNPLRASALLATSTLRRSNLITVEEIRSLHIAENALWNAKTRTEVNVYTAHIYSVSCIARYRATTPKWKRLLGILKRKFYH
jgi:hypothetical protein